MVLRGRVGLVRLVAGWGWSVMLGRVGRGGGYAQGADWSVRGLVGRGSPGGSPVWGMSGGVGVFRMGVCQLMISVLQPWRVVRGFGRCGGRVRRWVVVV